MTRTSDNRLQLSIGNWIAALSAVVSILGSIWGAWGALSNDVAVLKTDVAAINQRLGRLEDQPPPLTRIVPRPRETASGQVPKPVPVP